MVLQHNANDYNFITKSERYAFGVTLRIHDALTSGSLRKAGELSSTFIELKIFAYTSY